MSEGAFYDVSMVIPATARIWARSEDDAKNWAMHNARVVVGRVAQIAVGFPERMEVREVEFHAQAMHVIKSE